MSDLDEIKTKLAEHERRIKALEQQAEIEADIDGVELDKGVNEE